MRGRRLRGFPGGDAPQPGAVVQKKARHRVAVGRRAEVQQVVRAQAVLREPRWSGCSSGVPRYRRTSAPVAYKHELPGLTPPKRKLRQIVESA